MEEAVLQMKIWQVVEVILHCLVAAILKISISNATRNNCFIEHTRLPSRELGACGCRGWTEAEKVGGCGLGMQEGMCERWKKRRREARGWGAAMLRDRVSASFQTPILCHRGCGGELFHVATP